MLRRITNARLQKKHPAKSGAFHERIRPDRFVGILLFALLPINLSDLVDLIKKPLLSKRLGLGLG
jgi:hypothetical protein